MSVSFSHVRPTGKGTLEALHLPMAEKENLARSLLEEFAIPVHSHNSRRQELIIPCTLGPHHNQDHDPTGAFNYDKLVYKCLGCQRSGGLLWFIAEHRGGTSTEAKRWLGRETGTDGNVQELQALLSYFDSLYAARPERVPIPTYSERMLDPWALIHPWVTDPPEYDQRGHNIGGRGIPEENAVKFRVGYAEEFPYSQHQTSERVVFPHFWKGRLVGWQSRRLANDGTHKYKSSNDFPKDTTLYNYEPDAHPDAIVVESPPSVIRHDHHQHLVGTFGANVTDRQVTLLGRYPRLYWWLDNDDAGWNAYQGVVKDEPGVLEASARMTDVWVIDSPFHADPADLPDDLVDDLKASAVPWVVWHVPKTLICPRCGDNAHTGGCGGGEDE
jgi:hypothetical protein